MTHLADRTFPCLLACLLAPGVALAAEDPSAATTTTTGRAVVGDAPAGAELDATEWGRRYDQARASMLAGRFPVASATFAELAGRTSDPTRQILAREHAEICERWARGGFVLIRSSDLAAVSARAAEPLPDRRSADELGVLYTAAVLYGLGSGVALDTWTEPGSAAGGILPVLALGGAAAGLVYLLDTPHDLHYGVPQSITSGMWIGFEEGLAWTLWNQARATSAGEWSTRTVALTLWGTATAGAVLGGALGTVYGTTPGRASLVGSAALWSGLVAGLLGATVVSGDADSSTDDDAFMLTSAIGLTAGAAAGVLVGREVSPSIARVRFLDLGAIAGGVLFGGLYLAISNGNPDAQRMTAAFAGGITAGLVIAWQLTSGMEPDYPRTGHAPNDATASFAPMIAPSADSGHLGGGDYLSCKLASLQAGKPASGRPVRCKPATAATPTGEVPMNAIDMLEEQHREVEDLFEELGEARGEDKDTLFAEIADQLAIHATIEERHFYPAVKERRTEDILLESLEEHLAIKRVLADLLCIDATDRTFDAKLKVLQDEVEHHLDEEENQLFPKVRRLLTDDELEVLGQEMATTQDELRLLGDPRAHITQETGSAAEI